MSSYNPNQPRDKRGRWTKRSALGAALLATVTALAGGGDLISSIGAGLDAGTDSGGAAGARTARARQAAKDGDEAEAGRRLGLKELKKDLRRHLQCAVQSFGQVQQYFVAHHCEDLTQRLIAFSDTNGNIIAATVMWVRMPSARSAEDLKRLEDTYGSGDVTPFATEVLGLGGFKFTGHHYHSRSDGSLVVIAETDSVQGRPNDAFLDEVAEVLDVLPPP